MKRKTRRRGKIALLVAVAILICDVPSILYAKTTQEKLEEAIEQKEEIQQELNEQNDHLDGLKDKKADLKSELKDLNTQLTEVSENLELLETQIAEKEVEIAETTAALEEARETEAWQYECMEKRIQYMYVEGEQDYLDLFFSIDSFSDFLNYSNYFSAMADYDRKMLEEYEATRVFIEEEEARLQQEKLELEDLQLAAEAEKIKVAGLISQTSNNISEYNDLIADAEAEAEALEKEMREAEADIKALEKKIAEEKALSEIAANSAWRDISEIQFADGDRKLLASIIYCEAGGEPYEGQVAVGAVVINRVLSSRYPDTVVGVIYQKYQFSPVGSGRLEIVLTTNRATESCYRAADAAMSGVTNVGNCLYFRTPIPGLTGINIGGHVFY